VNQREVHAAFAELDGGLVEDSRPRFAIASILLDSGAGRGGYEGVASRPIVDPSLEWDGSCLLLIGVGVAPLSMLSAAADG
jgi:hypothetical protein